MAAAIGSNSRTHRAYLRCSRCCQEASSNGITGEYPKVKGIRNRLDIRLPFQPSSFAWWLSASQVVRRMTVRLGPDVHIAIRLSTERNILTPASAGLCVAEFFQGEAGQTASSSAFPRLIEDVWFSASLTLSRTLPPPHLALELTKRQHLRPVVLVGGRSPSNIRVPQPSAPESLRDAMKTASLCELDSASSFRWPA